MTEPLPTAGLGFGLRLADGDLVVEDGALATVDGLPNLIQALTLRVLTPFGSDIFNATYGFDAAGVFGRPASARTVADLIRLNLVRTLATDARVREVDDVVVTPDADRRGWTAEVTVVPFDGQPRTLPLRIEA
ncbi:hypothetical protein WEI85_35745 [Actinomycetes bacterium KLBMP 9797]